MSLASWEVINQSFIFNHHSSWKGGGWRGPLAELQMSPKLGLGLLLCIESILDGKNVNFRTLSSFLPYWLIWYRFNININIKSLVQTTKKSIDTHTQPLTPLLLRASQLCANFLCLIEPWMNSPFLLTHQQLKPLHCLAEKLVSMSQSGMWVPGLEISNMAALAWHFTHP